MSQLTVNSYFSGIGGFDLAFEKAGFKVNYQCEINKFCVSILNKHWPKTLRSNDIREVKVDEIPEADVWCAGFPCQDVSIARGALSREGLKGKNSGLFFDFFELIKAKKPNVVLIENVTGLLSSHNGNDFKIIIQSLTAIGYGVSWRVFNTRYFGTPQSRPRVYICAWKKCLDKAMYVLHEFEASLKHPKQRGGFLTPYFIKSTGAVIPEVAYCLAATSGRHTGMDWSRTYISYKEKVRRLTPNEAEKLQGFPASWTLPVNNSVNKVISDVDALRYHSIGNAVSVPVVIWLAERIKRIYNEPLVHRGVKSLMRNYADFSTPTLRAQFFSAVQSSTLFTTNDTAIKWQSGGIALGDNVFDSKVSSCPTNPLKSLLIDIIDDHEVGIKYYLSPSAARGILRRVRKQGRKLFPPLTMALEKLAACSEELLLQAV